MDNEKREEEFFETDELPEIPETLRGEPESEEETEEKTETETKPGELPDLSDFLDENTEVDSIADIDPELDKALSEFADDGDDENKEPDKDALEAAVKIVREQEKAKKLKFIKKVSAICVLALVLIGGGLFAFWQLDNYNNGYIMTFDDKKISMEEFKFFLIFSQSNYEVKQDTVNMMTQYMLLEKAVKERNIVLTPEEAEAVKEHIEYVKKDFAENNMKMPKISNDRLEFVFGTEYLVPKLMEAVAEENNYAVDETALAAAFEDYKNNNKADYVDMDFKYLLTDSEETANEARDALIADPSLADDIIKKYFIDYPEEETEIPMMSLYEVVYQLGILDSEGIEHLLSLQVGDISDTLYIMEMYYIIFITEEINIPDDEGLMEWFREYYQYDEKSLIFEQAYNSWKDQTPVKINEKAFENFDEEKYFESLYGNQAAGY